MSMTPEGNLGNFFGVQNRSAGRIEWLENWSLAPFNLLGTHLLKMGSSFTHASDEGQFNYQPIDILDTNGTLEEHIDFSNPAPFNRTDLEVTAYAQDHWSLNSAPVLRLRRARGASKAGVQSSRGPARRLCLEPFRQPPHRRPRRLWFVLRPPPAGYLHLWPLPPPHLTFYAPDGTIVGEPIPFINVIGSSTGPRSFFVNGQQVAGAFSPRGGTLNLQLEHSFSPLLRIRGVYTDNQSVGLVVIEPEELGTVQRDCLERRRQIALPPGRSDRQVRMETRPAAHSLLHSQPRRRKPQHLRQFPGNFPHARGPPRPLLQSARRSAQSFPGMGPREDSRSGTGSCCPSSNTATASPTPAWMCFRTTSAFPIATRPASPIFFSADARLMKDFKVNPKYTLRLSLTGLEPDQSLQRPGRAQQHRRSRVRSLFRQLSPPLSLRFRSRILASC